jgi:hypothetical protein
MVMDCFRATGFAACLAGMSLLAFTGQVRATGLQVVHTYVPQLTAGLAPQGAVDTSQQLHLTIGLPLRDQAGLTTLLQTIYDSSSPNFHNFQTPQQLAERFGASDQDLQAVADWAAANGLKVAQTHANRLVIELDGSVADVQKAFNVTINQYNDPVGNRTFYAPDREPTIDLAVPVRTISGLDSCAVVTSHAKIPTDEQAAAIRAAKDALKQPALPPGASDNTPVPTGPSPQAGSGPSGSYAGCDFRAAYAPGVALTGAGQTVGLLQFDNYYDADITAYKNAFGIPNIPTTRVPITVSDPPAPGGGNLECSLDIEMAMAMAPGLGGIYVYETGAAGNYTAMLSRMQSDNFSKQLSSSWSLNFIGNPHAYIAPDPTVESIFQLMAAQGQSFFQASGDFDAWTNSGSVYFPWPMDSVNITLVGGTTLSTAGPCGARTGEVVWNWGGGTGSSGGISTYYSTPWWQASTPVGPASGSAVRRNIPDVALTADQIHVRYGNGASINTVGGTSCAAPLWAGFMALVNQQAMNAGRAPIGFLNPAAYTIGNSASYLSAFNDCTTGNNFWTASPSLFSAVPGYDLCTGWGTPNGQVLINLLAGDPAPPSIVGNGGFETGAFPPWTQVGNTGSTSVSGSYAHAGSFGGQFGPVTTLGGITQTIDTIPGKSYVLSFWLENPSGGTGTEFRAIWNGILLVDQVNPAASGWTLYTLNVVATGPSTTIEFDFRHDPAWWGFDDVGVTPAPQIQDEIANPGFETGSFAGWTQGGNTGSTSVGGPPYNHTGLYGATFGPVGSLGSISQTIQTVPGQRYILSFWLDNPFGGTGTEFKALWNGGTLTDQVNPPPTGWIDYHYTVTATSPTTVIEFDFRQDPSFWGFDDVSVSPIYDYQGITFDDLPPTSGGLLVPNMYGGVMWNNFVYYDGFHQSGSSGYQVASVSPVNIAFNSGGNPATISNAVPFNLNSAYLTAAWNDNLNVEARGYLHGTLMYDNNYTLSAVAPTLINFNYRGVDQVVFISSGGTPHPGYTGGGTHFAMDNVVITTFQGLTFDDLPTTTDSPIPTGYGSLSWSANFHYLDAVHFGTPSGYGAGTVSRDSVGYNYFANPVSVVSAVPFNFDSAYLTAAWNDNLQLNAKGYYHGVLVYNQTYSLSATVPSLINFNFANVTEVDFTSSGGTPHGYTGSGTHFVIDNITTSYPRPQFDAAYLRSSSGEPWGTTDSDTAMNRVFGTNHWQDLRYDSVNPMSLFTPATHFVYMEGSEYNWHDMIAFLNGNRNLIEGWVNDGGYLFVNAAPNEGTGGLIVFDTQIYRTNQGPLSTTGTAVNPANPIFNGPFTPVGTSWTGNFFAHALVVGDGSLYPLINGVAGPVLGELWPGLGHVMVGAMTEPTFHNPQPQAFNLRANILAYAAGARGTAEVQGTFDDLPGGPAPVPNGYLGVNWNNISYGSAPANSGYVPGTISSPHIAYNPGGTAANINSPNPFDLHSAYFTAAWNDNLQLRVQGYNRGNLIYDQTYTLQATMPTFINFDFLGVTEVDFTTSGGVPHAGYTGAGTHFVLDNILISTGDAVASGIDHFVWSAIPSPECMGPLFPVTVTAKDGNNNTVTTFNGNVSFNAWSGVSDIDNFDTGIWPHAPWVLAAGGVAYGASTTAHIHDGASGFTDSGGGSGGTDWYYRTDVSIGSAGDAVSWWVRTDSALSGRAYLGFAAGAGGTWAVVVAPNTSQFVLQNDNPYGTFQDVTSGDQTWLPGKWYKVQVVFTSSSSVNANLYDSDGITLLNTLSATGITGAPGGVAIRSFGGFSLDTLQRGNPVLSAVLPPVSGSFVNGVWSGSLQTPLPASSMIITATEGLRGQSGSSNPFAVAPLTLSVTKVAGGVNVCWNTCVGGHYQLQQKSGNILNPWTNVGGVLTAGGAQLCVTLAEPPPPWNFFRVIVVP